MPRDPNRCRSADKCPRRATVAHFTTGRLTWCEHHAAELARIRADLAKR